MNLMDSRLTRGLDEKDADHMESQWTISATLRKKLVEVIVGDMERSRAKSDSKDILAGDVAVNLAYEVGRRDYAREVIKLLGLTVSNPVV